MTRRLSSVALEMLGEEAGLWPSPGGELTGLPVHGFALVYLGVHLFDNVALDDVAEAAAARTGGSSC